MNATTRAPAVAGSFYPEDAGELAAEVDKHLGAGTPAVEAKGRLKALIAPHAGYVYSGPVAGTAYRLLRDVAATRARRVVLMGPAHYVSVWGMAGPGVEAMATPLGEVRVDPVTAEVAPAAPEAHAPEHSLEVHLPFLQRVLAPGFTVVPLLVGHARPEQVAEALEWLWGGEETVMIVSSDLSHYLPYVRARSVDEETARSIESMNAGAMEPDRACGAAPLRGLLQKAHERGLRCRRLDLRNSGDTAGDRRRVVGYGAFALEASG